MAVPRFSCLQLCNSLACGCEVATTVASLLPLRQSVVAAVKSCSSSSASSSSSWWWWWRYPWLLQPLWPLQDDCGMTCANSSRDRGHIKTTTIEHLCESPLCSECDSASKGKFLTQSAPRSRRRPMTQCAKVLLARLALMHSATANGSDSAVRLGDAPEGLSTPKIKTPDFLFQSFLRCRTRPRLSGFRNLGILVIFLGFRNMPSDSKKCEMAAAQSNPVFCKQLSFHR